MEEKLEVFDAVEETPNDVVKETPKYDKPSILDMYGENLIEKEYVTNPAIGRDREIEETILILLTPEKSALLVGKPGIGKTALVEGLAYRMQKGEVPDALKPYQLIKINIPSLLGTTNVDGNSESRLELLVEELKAKENIILFIDEIHLLVNRNTTNLNVDFANMLKPGLDRGTIKMVGATTTEEYEQYILRDRAFLRRFLRVDIVEPTIDETVKILMGTYPKFEKKTGVKMTYTDFIKEKIFRFIVNLTEEYNRVYEIGNRYPDVALALLSSVYSMALFENASEVKLKHVYKAVCRTKAGYEDAKEKELVKFKEIFKDLIAQENLDLNDK